MLAGIAGNRVRSQKAITSKATTLTYFCKNSVRLLVGHMMNMKRVVTMVSVKLYVFQEGVIYKHLLTAWK